jgi:hypothetical protein
MSSRIRRILLLMKHRAKVILSVLALYISFSGLVTFSLFILEESIQTAMFGTWPAQDAKDWEVVKFGCERIRDANWALKAVNYSLGWIQPLAFVAYRSYGKSTDIYIQGLEARIFANAPELFAGREMSFSFTPEAKRDSPEGTLHINRNLTFISRRSYPAGVRHRLTGTVSVDGNRIIIREAESPSQQLSKTRP